MRRLLLVSLLVVACKTDKKPKQEVVHAKEQAVEAAREAAGEAKHAMQEAEQRAAEAWQRAEAAQADEAQANDENEDAKTRLAKVREEAAETVKLADAKLAQLDDAAGKLAARIEQATKEVAAATDDKARAYAQTTLASLQAQRDALENTIKKIAQMKSELATSAAEPVDETP